MEIILVSKDFLLETNWMNDQNTIFYSRNDLHICLWYFMMLQQNFYSSGAGKIQESGFSILKNAGKIFMHHNMDSAGPQPISFETPGPGRCWSQSFGCLIVDLHVIDSYIHVTDLSGGETTHLKKKTPPSDSLLTCTATYYYSIILHQKLSIVIYSNLLGTFPT